MSFKQQLIEMDACQEAIDWVENRTIKEAWTDCQRGDWMLWLLEQMEGEKGWLDEKKIMLLGCWCTRRALKYVPEGETRPLKAIETKEKWAKGETTREEMDVARSVAMTAASDAEWAAARSAAWAAVNDTVNDSANDAARSAAWAAAWAAAYAAASDAEWNAVWDAANDTTCDVTWTAAYNKESSIQTDYIRTQFTPPKGDLCLSNNN